MSLERSTGEADETEEVIDRVTTVVIDRAIDLEQGGDMNLKITLSVRMTLDEGLGYIGGQRLCHERPNLTVLAIDQFSNVSWRAMRRSHFDRGDYRTGFVAGFQDELAGIASPLPEELPLSSR